MMVASTSKWISSDQPIDFYLSRILLLCNLIPLNVGPHLQFDYRRRVGKEVSWRWSSIKLLLLRWKRAMNKDVAYNYGARPVSL
jgi:hypothetical protein